MTSVQSTGLLSAHPQIVASELPDGLALLDLRAGQYYALNSVGAHVWKAMQSPVAVRDIVTSVCASFDVVTETCETDVASLLSSLMRAGLVEAVEVAPSP
jgi:hypothetical protein